MRIELRRSGGFAGNIRRPPLTVDTEALPPAERGELETLVDALDLAALARTPAPRGADHQQLELTVERGGVRQSVAVNEAGAPAELHALVRRLGELGRS